MDLLWIWLTFHHFAKPSTILNLNHIHPSFHPSRPAGQFRSNSSFSTPDLFPSPGQLKLMQKRSSRKCYKSHLCENWNLCKKAFTTTCEAITDTASQTAYYYPYCLKCCRSGNGNWRTIARDAFAQLRKGCKKKTRENMVFFGHIIHPSLYIIVKLSTTTYEEGQMTANKS